MPEEEETRNAAQAPSSPEGPSQEGAAPPRDGAPEPPLTYKPQPNPHVPGDQGSGGRSELESLRRMVGASQIMAFVSFIVGGVVLSAAAVVVGLMGYRKVSQALQAQTAADARWAALKRAAAVAVAIGVVALVANIVALAVLYPMVAEMLQTGDYSTLWGSAEPPASSSSSFWG